MAVVLLLGGGALGLAACGGDQQSAGGGNAPSVPAEADFNAADVLFLQSMIPHHEQAVEMSELALDPATGAGPEVVALATRIQGAQDGEINQMKGWLTGWKQPTEMDTSGGHDMSKMEGMMGADQMSSLDAATNSGFDRMWLTMMVEHHEGAIGMATTVKSGGENADVAKLADEIIGAQQGEISEMKTLLAK